MSWGDPRLLWHFKGHISKQCEDVFKGKLCQKHVLMSATWINVVIDIDVTDERQAEQLID